MTDITYRGFEINTYADEYGISARVKSRDGENGEKDEDVFWASEYIMAKIDEPNYEHNKIIAIEICINRIKKEIDELYNIIPKNIEELTEYILNNTRVDYGFGTYIDPKVVGILVDNYYKNKV
jgi:hypothetical protein